MNRRSARVFIKNKQGLYLALFQKSFNKYILPGGKCEPDETFIDCVIRETKEETNLSLKNIS
jgi:8-oxo-dGTP pyrophosphatase MutT (NUDIX family)